MIIYLTLLFMDKMIAKNEQLNHVADQITRYALINWIKLYETIILFKCEFHFM